MIKNILLWDSEWERTQQITENLKKLERGGKIRGLCLVREGQACFRAEGTADWIPRGLSELLSEKTIEHAWAGEDDCGSALWQDGRESRYTVSYGSPEWDALVKSVEERTLACETLRDFREKVDACWQAHVRKYRRLTLEQFGKHAAAIAAMQLCYKKLKVLSWHHTWIAALNQIDDPLKAVCSAWLAAMGERVQVESFDSVFDQAICDVADSGDEKQEHNTKPGPSLDMSM